MTLETLEKHRCFGGDAGRLPPPVERDRRCAMRFAVYVPPQAAHGPLPVLYWLSGLTCTEENFTIRRAPSATPPSTA